jgi:hypothetical protein
MAKNLLSGVHTLRLEGGEILIRDRDNASLFDMLVEAFHQEPLQEVRIRVAGLSIWDVEPDELRPGFDGFLLAIMAAKGVVMEPGQNLVIEFELISVPA